MKKIPAVLFVSLLVILPLLSCGGKEDKENTQTSSTSSTPATTDAARTARDLLQPQTQNPPTEKPPEEKPPTTQQDAAAAAVAKQVYDDAIAFANENPNSYKAVIEKLRKAQDSLAGTEWKDKIAAKLDAVLKELENKGNEAYAAIEKAFQTHVANRDFEAAGKAVSEFPKALSESQGAKKAAALRDKLGTEQRNAAEADLKVASNAAAKGQFAQAVELYKKVRAYGPGDMQGKIDEYIMNIERKVEQDGPAAVVKVIERYDALFTEVIKMVEAGQAEAALDKCDALMQSQEYNLAVLAKKDADDETFAQVQNLASDLKQAVALTKKVLGHYTGLIGQNVEISLRSTKEKALVVSVEGESISIKSSAKARTLTIADLKQEDMFEILLKEGSKEAFGLVIAFCLACGKPESAQKIAKRAQNAGLDVEAWKERIAAVETYLKLAKERNTREEAAKAEAEVMKNLNKQLERAIAAFKTEKYDETMGLLSSIYSTGKRQPPEMLKELSTRCATLSGYTLATLAKFGRINCKGCGNQGIKTCPKCGGSGQVLGPMRNQRREYITCPQCGGKTRIVCRDCQARRMKKDYEAVEVGLVEAEMK